MTRKSEAKVKPIRAKGAGAMPVQPELPPIEETFEKAKQAFVNTAEVAVVIANRIDNLLNIRKAYHEFWHADLRDRFIVSESMEFLKAKQAMTVACYEEIAKTVEGFELDEFLKEDMKDYFEYLMPKCEEMESEDDLFDAFLIAGIVKPWGEKMTALHHQMLQEQDARKPIDD